MIIDHPAAEWKPHLHRLWQTAFGDSDAFLNDFFSTAYAPSRCLCAWEDNELVAAVYWFGCTCQNKRIAYIYALAVDEACRGHGIGTRLMEKTHAVLEAQGYAGVLLVPQDARLQALYARLGYDRGPAMGEWHCRAADKGISLQQLDAPSYAAARRAYLPENGVLQEGENLRFLQTQARFWAGEGFILAARREENRLMGLELLGNSQAAPCILHTLRCTEGTFRTPALVGTAIGRPQPLPLEELPVGAIIDRPPVCSTLPCPPVFEGNAPQSQEKLAPRIYEGGGPQGRREFVRPFAMFRPLGQTPAPMPTYFAFAFD